MKTLKTDGKFSPLAIGGIIYLIAMTFFIIGEIRAIDYSAQSTAAIGYLFLPFAALISCSPWFVIGILSGYGARWIRTRSGKDLTMGTLGLLLLILYSGYLWQKNAETTRLLETVATIDQMDTEQLDDFVTKGQLNDNKYILGAVCLNPETATATLAKIVALKGPDLHRKMWHIPEIMGANTRGLAVMRLVISHPNATPELLVLLSESSDPYVLGDVAGNRLTPREILLNLYQKSRDMDNGYLIEWGLASNPATPPDVLRSLATSEDSISRERVRTNRSFLEHSH